MERSQLFSGNDWLRGELKQEPFSMIALLVTQLLTSKHWHLRHTCYCDVRNWWWSVFCVV